MKRFVASILVFVLVTILLACESYEFDLEDFEDRTASTFYTVEHQPDNRYVLYYFDSTKSDLDTIRRDVLPIL